MCAVQPTLLEVQNSANSDGLTVVTLMSFVANPSVNSVSFRADRGASCSLLPV